MFLRRGPREDANLIIRTGDLVIRPPRMDDHLAWAKARDESRAFLAPWEPIWPADDLTRAAFRRRLSRYDLEIRRDEAYPVLVFLSDNRTPVGGLTLGNVRRGVSQTAALGYWMASSHAGRGIMTSAVLAVCHFAFLKLTLHRIEAACLPENAPSIRLLEKAGFLPEGRARQYLCIAGEWRDHLLFARLAHDLPGRPASGPAGRSERPNGGSKAID
jgi:ribosomal-protein-alanine N-acetyltransferase